jgi:tetratricopeptide (TPR) repeat protein
LCEQALHEVGGGAATAEERRARQVLAEILLDRGDVVAARRCLEPALPTGAEQASIVDAFCLVTQAEIEVASGDLDVAAAAAQHVVVTGSFGSLSWLGTTARSLLGATMFERGDLALARSWLGQSLALGEQLGDVVAVTEAHLQLVEIECAASRLADADAHFRAAVGSRQDVHRRGDLPFLEARAMLALAGRSPAEAVELGEAALALANDIGSACERCRCLRLLGDAYLAATDGDRALATFEQLVAHAGAAPYPCRLAEGHEGAAAAASTVGELRAAHRHLAAATKIRERTGTRRVCRPTVEGHLTRLETEHTLGDHSV